MDGSPAFPSRQRDLAYPTWGDRPLDRPDVPLRGSEAERAHSEHIFGIFETNGWHSLLALLLGVVSLYFAVRSDHAREVALVIGAVHVAVVVALLMWSPSTFLLASNTADQVIHSFTAIGGLVGGLLTPRGGTDP
jgi:hypothetical protein